MMNNGYTPRSEFYMPNENMCYDNKSMVRTLSSTTASIPQQQQQQNVRIDITDHLKEKNTSGITAAAAAAAATVTATNTTTSQTHHKPFHPFRLRKTIRLPGALNFVLAVTGRNKMRIPVAARFIFATIILELGYLPLAEVGFYCDDPALSYPFRGDTISTIMVLVSNLIVVPLLVLFTVELLSENQNSLRVLLRQIWEIYKEILVGCALVILLTVISKTIIREHRPHFFDICKPDRARNCSDGEYVEKFICTQTVYSHYFVTDSSRSFPSGHSSLSTFVALFCSYIIQIRISTIRTGRIVKEVFIALCLIWSLTCSFTRITDRRHHWWDVCAGMVLGALCAIYYIKILDRKLLKYGTVDIGKSSPTRKMTTSSTTTLFDIKNKDAKSEII